MTVMGTSATQDIGVGLPLAISSATILGTIVIHALALMGIVYFVRRQHRLKRTGSRFWMDVAIVSTATLLTGLAHLVEITMWAVVFMSCGEFSRFAPAIYNSAMLYTTMGYGDVAMSAAWKMLGPFEAADGMLMFGVSTAIVIAVIQLMVRTRFRDLPDL
jgi:hypothetical protein